VEMSGHVSLCQTNQFVLEVLSFPLLSRGNDNLQFSRVPETVRQTAN
jgi:hypothetical protein